MELVAAADYDALAAEWMSLSQDDGKVERALESAQARVRELEDALREALAQMESDAVFHEYDRGHRSISEMPDNDLPDALLHARATLARATVDREGEHE
jgi:hypothetical protein